MCQYVHVHLAGLLITCECYWLGTGNLSILILLRGPEVNPLSQIMEVSSAGGVLKLSDIFSDHHPLSPTVFCVVSGLQSGVSRALLPRGPESGVHQGTAFLGFAPLLDQYIPWNTSPRWMRQSSLVSEAPPASRVPTLPGSQSRALRDGWSGRLSINQHHLATLCDNLWALFYWDFCDLWRERPCPAW